MMDNDFKIRFCSDLDYEEMVVDVCWKSNTIATINQEKGIRNIEIKIFSPPEGLSSWNFPLNDLLEILLFAKKNLELSQQD